MKLSAGQLQKNKLINGFALVEIMISIAISSVLSLVLFTILLQVQKSAQLVASDVSIGIQVMTGYDRLQKDLTGMFWPIGPEISKIVFSENTHFNDLEILKECSFITSNPLQVYGEVKPRVARIIYTLEPEESSNSNRFILYRQETTFNLDYQQAKKDSPKFALISGLRSLNLDYFYQEQATQQNPEPDLIKKQELILDQIPQQAASHQPENNQQDLAGRVPSYIKLNLSLWTSSEQKDYQEFKFWFYINNHVVDPPVGEQKNSKNDQAK